MGTKERRQRQYEDREQQFLDCARALIREEGLLNLQLTRIAELCEYAVGTLYRHFPSKEDLLLALTIRDAKRHAAMFRRVADWRAASRERMLAIAVADKVFVQHHPEFFRLEQYVLTDVVWRAASAERRQAFLAESIPIGRIVVQIIEDALVAGDLDPGGFAPSEICTCFWALSSGTHNLAHAEGVLDDLHVREPYRLLCRHVHVLLNGFGWRPLYDTHDFAAHDLQISRIREALFHDLRADEPGRSRPDLPGSTSPGPLP